MADQDVTANGAADGTALNAFVGLLGRTAWQQRIDAIVAAQPVPGRISHCGRDVIRRHAIEISIERQRRPASTAAARPVATRPAADTRIAGLAAEAVRLATTLSGSARDRFHRRLEHAMLDGQSLTPLFHLLRTASLHRSRGFEVAYSGAEANTPFDLCLRRDRTEAEVVCDVVSADAGRDVQRDAWFRLADMVAPDLRNWIAANPGRYLLKMTLPQGLKVGYATQGVGDVAGGVAGGGGGDGVEGCPLGGLRHRICSLLADRRRSECDAAAMIRLEPLGIPGRDVGELGIAARLRAALGPDTRIAVTVDGTGVFAMTAHAARADDVPAAVHRRMSEIAPSRLSGERPGILAMFVEDTEPDEWSRLARDMTLEAQARQFLTTADARHVVSVACSSRHELFSPVEGEGEFRFRNPRHSAAKLPELAPSIMSSN